MSENAGQFRNTVFGGFHRQDVLDYIERMTRESRLDYEHMEVSLEEERTQRCKAEDALSEVEERAERAEEAEKTLEEELSRVKVELQETAAALKKAETSNALLEAQVRELEPGAESWQRIKDTAGDIEVAAHERAQMTIQEARAQVAEIQAEGVRWVLEAQNRCENLQAELKQAIIAAEAELDLVRSSFSRAEQDMERIQTALSDLISEGDPDVFSPV